jgi:hypothetical protein
MTQQQCQQGRPQIDAVAIANATARSLVWYPRVDGTMNGAEIYPDTHSAWTMGFVNKNVFFNGKDGKTMNSDARVLFYYPYTAVTPAMALTKAGAGSDYGIDLPPNPPVKDFWALTMYDNQTRSQLQTSQKFPTVGSQTRGIKQNADGSYDIYFSPKPPKGFAGSSRCGCTDRSSPGSKRPGVRVKSNWWNSWGLNNA